MIRLITIITKYIAATLLALFCFSCNIVHEFNSVSGSGKVITEVRDIKQPFDSFEISNALELVIQQGQNQKVEVSADDNIIKDIVTEVDNNTLKIYFKSGSFNHVSAKKIVVTLPYIKSIKASSASNVSSKNKILAQNLNIDASSAANIDLNTDAESIIAQASSAALIKLKGKALELASDASSGSDIDAKDLQTNDIQAEASSGASINIYPILKLNASASSGADINYFNTPKHIVINKSSGGSISQK